MKKFYKLFLLLSLATTLFYSCKKNENSTPDMNENAYYVDGKKVFDINFASIDLNSSNGTTFLLSKKITGSELPYDNNEYILIELPKELIGKKTSLFGYEDLYNWAPWINSKSTSGLIDFDIFLDEDDYINSGVSQNDYVEVKNNGDNNYTIIYDVISNGKKLRVNYTGTFLEDGYAESFGY